MVVVCFVGHNFLKYANLSLSKKPRAKIVASSQVQVCKETLKKLETVVSVFDGTVSALTISLPSLSTGIPPSLIQPVSVFPAEIVSVTAPRAPPFNS